MLLLLLAIYTWLLLVFHAGSLLLKMSSPWPSAARVLLPLISIALVFGLIGQSQGAAFWWRLPAWSQGGVLAWGALLLWMLLIPGRGLLHLLRIQRDMGLLKGQLRALDHLRAESNLDLEQVCEALGLKPPRLFGMRGIDSPFVLGTFSPGIVLPVEWLPKAWRGTDPLWDSVGAESTKSAMELRAALLHELAHVRNGDVGHRLMSVFGTIVLPWEWVSTGSPRRRFWIPQWASLEAQQQEAKADALARRMTDQPPVEMLEARIRGTLAPALVAVLWAGILVGGFALLPGRGALAVAMGLDVPRYGLLPAGWRLSPGLPRTMIGKAMLPPKMIFIRAGMLPQRPGQAPRLRLDMPVDLPQNYMNANLSHFSSVHSDDLPKGSQIELRWEIDAPASVSFTGGEVGIDLRAFAGTRIHYFRDMAIAKLASSEASKPGLRRWVFVARKGVPEGLGVARVIAVGFGPTHKGSYVLNPPSLVRIDAEGRRSPFRTLQ